MSPTARTLALLRAEGYLAEVVEKWNPWSHTRKDLWGWADILAMKDGERSVLAIQATSGTNVSARVLKIAACPSSRVWLACGGRIEVWGWAKRGARGAKKTWTVRKVVIA